MSCRNHRHLECECAYSYRYLHTRAESTGCTGVGRYILPRSATAKDPGSIGGPQNRPPLQPDRHHQDAQVTVPVPLSTGVRPVPYKYSRVLLSFPLDTTAFVEPTNFASPKGLPPICIYAPRLRPNSLILLTLDLAMNSSGNREVLKTTLALLPRPLHLRKASLSHTRFARADE